MDTPSRSICPQIPYRIRIGVTGHRVLAHEEALIQRVRTVLDTQIMELVDPESMATGRTSPDAPIRLGIVSPLAEGADRLVARLVLDTEGGTLDAVLPLPKAEYVKDFASRRSRKEFRDLLEKSRSVTVPALRVEGYPAISRKSAYTGIGHYVVDHSDILIALWNGRPAAGRGGTAEIVAYARRKKTPLVIVSTNPPYDISVEPGHGVNTDSLRGVGVFNSFSVSSGDEISYADSVFKDLFEGVTAECAPAAKRTIIRDTLIPFYVRASKIAKKNQWRYVHAGSLVYLFSALAVGATALTTVLPHLSIYGFSIEFTLMSAILLLIFFLDKQRTHLRWIESRFLAERFRVAVFFAVCGFQVSPVNILPYMRVAHGFNDWMLRVFDEGWNILPRMSVCSPEQAEGLAKYIQEFLIKAQIRFHQEKAAGAGRRSRRLEIAGTVIFFAALFAALVHIVLFISNGESQLSAFGTLLTVLAITLPALGAAAAGIRSHREYIRLENRSKNMVDVLTDLDGRFALCRDNKELESLLREAEELMLRETQDWLMLMKFVILETTV